NNTMDPPKLGVMYKTWQHNFKYGIQKFMRKVGRDNMVKNLFFAGLARSLGGVPLSAMERFARRRGPEHEMVIEKIKASYW
ncbi:MAG: radical SAM protein, partial [Nitrososphaeraceae archaeon]